MGQQVVLGAARVAPPLPENEAHHFWTLALLCLGAVLGSLLLLYEHHRRQSRRSNFSAYVPIGSAPHGATVVVDSPSLPFKRSALPSLSHHKQNTNPPGPLRSDTSTGIVFDAIRASHSLLAGAALKRVMQMQFVTTNHFDTDSFLSVWVYINRDLALKHEAVLRHMARVGDFREAFLSPELVTRYGREDGITNMREAFTALKLVCWLNSTERKVFSRPYESKDCTAKFEYFLPRFAAVLGDPEPFFEQWQDEYKQVTSGFEALQGPGCSVEVHPKIGLAAISCPDPLHYYALFSHTHGLDVVLTMYDHQRYELECKYSQFVVVHSRPVWPRLDLTPLATVLNGIEVGLPPNTFWVADRTSDTGPLLRLECSDRPLSKAQRYGSPCDRARAILPSSIPPPIISAVVQSFLEFGLQGQRPRVGGFSWDELGTINAGVPWSTWSNAVLDQHDKGELKGGVGGTGKADRPELANAQPLELAPFAPPLSEPSVLMSEEERRALASVVPPRYSHCSWQLAYSTHRDGISLHTMLRKGANRSPTLLVVRDQGGHLFGAYAPEPWRIGPRFYGTGETSVWTLYPERLLYPWRRVKDDTSADFFQFTTHEGLGVGGSGHFAIWLDNDLLDGSSNTCNTFGSPCLAASSDFHVAHLELWHVV